MTSGQAEELINAINALWYPLVWVSTALWIIAFSMPNSKK